MDSHFDQDEDQELELRPPSSFSLFSLCSLVLILIDTRSGSRSERYRRENRQRRHRYILYEQYKIKLSVVPHYITLIVELKMVCQLLRDNNLLTVEHGTRCKQLNFYSGSVEEIFCWKQTHRLYEVLQIPENHLEMESKSPSTCRL